MPDFFLLKNTFLFGVVDAICVLFIYMLIVVVSMRALRFINDSSLYLSAEH